MTEPTCGLCGCTEHRACCDEARGPCGWTDEPDVCTHCADSIALLDELTTRLPNPDEVPEDVLIELPLHHAEQLLKVLNHTLLRPAPRAKPEPWLPTHRHLSTGGLYRTISMAIEVANDRSGDDKQRQAVVYDNPTGQVFVRLAREFLDGRFEPLPVPVP